MGGALGGMVRQNWTFHLRSAAWSGNCRERDEENMYDAIFVVFVLPLGFHSLHCKEGEV